MCSYQPSIIKMEDEMEKQYSIRKDTVTAADPKAQYYIRENAPACFLTDNMGKREVNKLAKHLRQLGFTVTDTTKDVIRRAVAA